jgi:hypothetical protein
MDTDKDILTLQSEESSLAEQVKALKNLTKKQCYKLTRCPSCRNIVVRDSLTGEEIMIDNRDILHEFVELPYGE